MGWPGVAMADWWASVDDIGRVYDVPPATVYRWANRYGWRKGRRYGHTVYHWLDVDETAARLTMRATR